MPVFVDKISHGHHLFEQAGQQAAGPGEGLTIGLVNNMPDSALVATERQVFDLLRAAAADMPVRLKFYSLPGVARTEWGRDYVGRSYGGLDELRDSDLDGVIVTGAEPRTPTLPEESYWSELAEVIDWAGDNTTSAVWSCLAVHSAVLHLDGIDRRSLDEKCFGIFEQEKLADHPILEGAPERLKMPHSRWNEIRQDDLETRGYSVLTRSADAGVDIFVKQQARSLFVFFQGHPEYEALSLLGEYRRDVGRFLRGEIAAYPTVPTGYFADQAQQMLAEFRERAVRERRAELLASFPVEPLAAQLSNPWRPGAVGIYRNWLSYMSGHKASCGQALSRPGGRQ